VQSDYDPTANFASYRSFAFISEHPMIVTESQAMVNPLLEGRIMNAIRGNLSTHGLRYAEDPETADLAVSFSVGSREKIRVDSFPTT